MTSIKKIGTSFGMNPCSACGCERGFQAEIDGKAQTQIHICERCGALLGRCWKGDCPVLLVFCPTETAKAVSHSARRRLEAQLPEPRFFDFDLLGSNGVERVHGWFNPATMKVVQFG